MYLLESDQFKINLVNKLNKQRINGVNCDIEIQCLLNNDRIYTHSIIMNLFSVQLLTKTRSMCKISFPDEMSFVKTNCFDCLKQVINYLYEGEINVHPDHKAHVQSIVFNLKINLLIESLFSNTTVGLNENNEKCDIPVGNVLYSKTKGLCTKNSQLSTCSESENINQHSNTCSTLIRIGTNDTNATTEDRTVRHIIQSPLKKRLKFSRQYETVVSETEINVTFVTSSSGEEDLKNQLNNDTGNQMDHQIHPSVIDTQSQVHHQIAKDEIHSDGLHLLLSILEEENKKQQLLANNSKQDMSLATEKNASVDLPSTTIIKNELNKEKVVNETELNGVHEEIVQEEEHNPVEKTSQDGILCDNTQTQSTMAEVLDTIKPNNQVDENTLSNKTKNQVDQCTLLKETPGQDTKLKSNSKPKKMTLDKPRENTVKRKTGILKKKETEDTVIGVQDGFMCKKCKMFFDNISSLQEHMQGTHSKKLRCISCNFMTIKIRCFIDHLLQSRHEGTICSVCHFQTSTNEELHKHINKHKANLPKPFFCNDCDKTFATRRIWSVHLPVHSNETQFLCAVCSKGFKWRQGLERHMTTHGKEKPYLCSQCAFNTVNQAYLAKHILSHNKKEVCPHKECKHREIRKENLKAHLLTHSKVKRFQCELCGKSFGHAKNLDRHLESMHNPHTTELTCNQCSYVTVRLDKLKDHFKSKHKTYDYRQYVDQVKENVKTSVNTKGVKVNRHLMTKQTPCVENQTSNFQSVPLANSNQNIWSNPGQTMTNTSILTLPVTSQDGGLFRVNTLETKNTSLPIIMNINAMTTTGKNKVFVKSKQTTSISMNPLNRTIRSRTNKTRRQPIHKTSAETRTNSHRRGKAKDSSKSTSVLKTILENKSETLENNSSRFRNIAMKPAQPPVLPSAPLLSNGPILLIISNTPKNQIITNVSQVNSVKAVRKQLILSTPITGNPTPVSNTTSDRNDGKFSSDQSTFSSNGVNLATDNCRESDSNVNNLQYVQSSSCRILDKSMESRCIQNVSHPLGLVFAAPISTITSNVHSESNCTESSVEKPGLPSCATVSTTTQSITPSICNYLPPTSSSGNYLPPTSSSGNCLPPTSSSGNCLPPTSSNGNYLPPTSSSGNCLPPTSSSGNYLPPTSSNRNYLPPISSSRNYLPPASSSGNYLPPTRSSCNYLPPTRSNGNYLPPISSSRNYLPPTSSSRNYLHPTSSSSNSYFDVLDESTGELLFLTSKHIHNPLLDEETGELSVFEIPSSFINYIENITSSEYDNLLGPELSAGNEPMSDFTQDDLGDFSYRDDTFQYDVSQWSDNNHAAFVLNELTGELNVTAKR